MSGKKRPRLAAKDAAAYRAAVRARKQHKGLSDDAVLEALAGYDVRSRKWLQRALAVGMPLAIDTAIELAQRMRAVGARLPRDVEDRLVSIDEPVVIVPRGESARIAAALGRRWHALPASTRARLLRSTEAFFSDYERFADTATGRALLNRLESELGGGVGRPDPMAWRRFFQQMRRGQVDGDRVVVPDSLALAREQHPRRRKTR